MAIRLPTPEGDKPLVSEKRRKFLFRKLSGREPEIQAPRPRFTGSLLGSPRAGTQMGGAVGAGGMPQLNPAPFGYKDGRPLIRLFPRSEREQQEALAEKEFREYDPGYFSNKLGMPIKMGTPLGNASFKIRRAFETGDISASQARSIADRVMAYYGDKTQQELFSDITGTGGVESGMQQPAPRRAPARGSYIGSLYDPFQDDQRRRAAKLNADNFTGGTIKNTYI